MVLFGGGNVIYYLLDFQGDKNIFLHGTIYVMWVK